MYWVQRIISRRSAAKRLLAAFIAAVLVTAAGITGIAHRLGPLPQAAFNDTSRLVVDRHGRLLRAYTNGAGLWRLNVRPRDVDPRYLAMLFMAEDRSFYRHRGIDPRGIARAGWQNLTHLRAVSGASTLTMQVARLIDNQPTHSMRAKLEQFVRAWQLETAYSKDEILALYLKFAPFGGNLEGVRAASLAYFGKEPRHLSVAEAALLVALPQSPKTRRPDHSPEAAKRARDFVIERAERAGLITAAEARWAKDQPVPRVRHEFPALAAHLADRLLKEQPDEGEIRTTIDRPMQEAAEQLASARAAALGPKLSAAIIAADHQTGEVLAYVGSAGYFDEERFGSIDMGEAVRSPGSALKPFVYGLAFEDGFAHPQTLIEDRPVRFGTYAPENFDSRFHGTVTVAQALQMSLNVPAVKVLAPVGPGRLASRFRAAGFNGKMPRNLSVVLGGVGLTLEDLTRLYAALARGGEPVALRYRPVAAAAAPVPDDMPDSARPRLLSPLAAWYVTDILRDVPPPPNAPAGAVAFKTGTSYGYRDAWAAGYDGQHLVVAWTGRPDGTSTPGLMGLSASAPLVFDMLARISPVRAPFKPRPRSAVVATNAELPPPLRHFREPGAETGHQGPGEPELRIVFPPDKSEIEAGEDAGGERQPVILKAEGGVLPLTWLVDGAPLTAEGYQRQMNWTPAGKGFAQVTVIDAKGRSERVSFRVR